MVSPDRSLLTFVNDLSENEKTAFLLANLFEGFEFVPKPTITVTTTSAEIIARATDAEGPRHYSIFNNGAFPIWIQFGAKVPIGDASTPTYNGYGFRITGGNYYESPHATRTSVNAIAVGGSSKITVVLAVPLAPKRVQDCRAVCPST